MRRRGLAERRRELALAGAVLAIAQVAAGGSRAQSSPDDLDELDDLFQRSRLRLESASAAERVAATADLRRAFAAGHVDAALEALDLDRWPPTPAMHLRGLLVDLPLARATLLERACAGERVGLARELLVESFRTRADEQSPFRAELESGSEPRLPWSEHGVHVRRTGAPRAAIPWLELRRTLEDARVWSQPVVLFPGVADAAAMILAPLVAQSPAAGWLEVELLRRDLVPQRSAMATWIVPLALAPKRESSALPAGHEGELARQVIAEEKLFLRALESLASLSAFEQGRRGADLLAQLGLPCTPLAGREDEFARGVAAGLALHRIGPLAVAPAVATTTSNSADDANAANSANGQQGPPRPDAAELRVIFEQTIERLRLEIEARGTAPKPDPGLADRELSDRIDALADRLESDPLLGGELADLLRRSATAQPEGSSLRMRLERAASELWLLGRSARPGTRLVDIPSGTPPR